MHLVTQKGYISEKQIEQKLKAMVELLGGMCPKWVAPGLVGVPDRIILLPGGKIAFVELKAPGQKPRPIQLIRHQELRDLGFQVFVIDSIDKIKDMLNEIA